MNKQDFTITNGFPMNQAALGRMQTAYSVLNALGNIVGDKTIITGCELTGSTVADGVVFVNGEVFEFKGGVVQTTVRIKEDITNLIYKNGNSYPAVKTRYVEFGSGVDAMNWADFKRGFPTKNIDSLVARIVALEARPTVSNIPIDLIAIWGRPANEIPAGWIEYAPLAGRTAVGFNSADTDFDVVLKPGGSKTKTLSISEMPEHDHLMGDQSGSSGSGTTNVRYLGREIESNGLGVPKTDKTGGGQAFSIMNPFRTVHYIQFKGV